MSTNNPSLIIEPECGEQTKELLSDNGSEEDDKSVLPSEQYEWACEKAIERGVSTAQVIVDVFCDGKQAHEDCCRSSEDQFSYDPDRRCLTAERKLRTVGNSAALTIPPQILQALRVTDGDSVTISASIDDGCVKIQPDVRTD